MRCPNPLSSIKNRSQFFPELHMLEWRNAIFSLESYFVFKSKDVQKFWQCLLLRLDEIFRSGSIRNIPTYEV